MQPKQPKAETQAMSEYGEPWVLMMQGTYTGLENERGNRVKFDDVKNLSRIGKCVSALAGIPNPEAVRELIEAATEWYGSVCKHGGSVQVPDTRLRRAVAALTAPPASPQQK